jgi:hypothetical protein
MSAEVPSGARAAAVRELVEVLPGAGWSKDDARDADVPELARAPTR